MHAIINVPVCSWIVQCKRYRENVKFEFEIPNGDFTEWENPIGMDELEQAEKCLPDSSAKLNGDASGRVVGKKSWKMMLISTSSLVTLQLLSIRRCLSVIKEPDVRSSRQYAIILFCFLSLIRTSQAPFGQLATTFLQRRKIAVQFCSFQFKVNTTDRS
ncbi:hypothetical protein T01_8789 [Trichinella spiralis]|uniref:Uncharacterized protein n=1 Tax=Trichinella spiralis TaxID=6334 RepID=A0A0V1BHC2_TRISP|nr:hypothetical protein T01_8789 [Trichinella spiralis]